MDLADQLPEVCIKSCFIFSTSAIIGEDKVANDHSALRQKLVSKGYIVKGELNCKGFNTNSFLKFFGGMNKGRPNSEDLRNAAGICVESGVSIDHKNEMFPRLYLVINEMQFAAGYYEIKGVIGWITTRMKN